MTDVGDLRLNNSASGSPPGWVIAEVAASQHGVVAYYQLMRLGLLRHHVQHRVRNGYLRRVHHGVYAVGHAPLTAHGRWMAAVLACGPGALLSHRDAAALWDLRATRRRAIDVTGARSLKGHEGIALHRPRRLHPDDRAEVDGIPVTSVARMLLDFAEVASLRQLDRLVEQTELRGLFDLRAIDTLLERSCGRRGVPHLQRAIAGARPFVPFTRSELERAFADLCRGSGREPAMNVWVAGHEADALFAAERLVVEIDGVAVHGTRQAKRRDPMRDAALQIAGYRILRVSEEWLRSDPAGVARTVREMLDASTTWAA